LVTLCDLSRLRGGYLGDPTVIKRILSRNPHLVIVRCIIKLVMTTEPCEYPTNTISENSCCLEINIPLNSMIRSIDGNSVIRTIPGLVAWYTGDSWDAANRVWVDISGVNNHVQSDSINGTILNPVHNQLNKKIMTGTTGSEIMFPPGILPTNYTMFHLAKYNGPSRGRIFTAADQNWLSCFWFGRTGVAHHNGWITSRENFIAYDDWMLSTDQNKRYRANGTDYTLNGEQAGAISNGRLTVNNRNVYNETSEWAIAVIVIYNRTLTVQEFTLVEQALKLEYNL
jgi:hypothetical protein